ncbi:hypothetical protein ACI77F_07145 [Pseudomonas tritici]|uniref:hypothetical protein n=1 Tax=Pseudomonas tritici TaxID=2745518 RepID=UPI00387AA897
MTPGPHQVGQYALRMKKLCRECIEWGEGRPIALFVQAEETAHPRLGDQPIQPSIALKVGQRLVDRAGTVGDGGL